MINVREYRSAIVVALLAIAFLYTSWVATQIATDKKAIVVDNSRPDAFMENVVALEFDKEGNPHSRLTSSKVLHYKTNDTALLEMPHFIFYSTNKTPWHLTAKQGKSTNNAREVLLWDDVNLHEKTGSNNKESLMTTTRLTLYPKKDFAHTDQAVTLTQPGTIIHATGMNVYFKEKRVQLLSHMRGTHENVDTN